MIVLIPKLYTLVLLPYGILNGILNGYDILTLWYTFGILKNLTFVNNQSVLMIKIFLTS